MPDPIPSVTNSTPASPSTPDQGGRRGRHAVAGEPAPSTTARTVTPRPASRDPYFDNAKFLLILLVILGHGWGTVSEGHQGVRALYLFVYTFHMPAFILISGYFSRNFDGSPTRVKRLVGSLLVPYLLFDACYDILFDLIRGHDLSTNPVNAAYATWFLLALFLWRLTSPMWRVLRWPVPIAFALSLVAGMTELPGALSLGRVLQFLPWFVIGLCLRPEHFAWVRRPPVRWATLAMATVCMGGAFWLAGQGISNKWFFNTVGYQQLGVGLGTWLPVRLGILLTGAAMTLAFLAWVPARRTWYTALGAGTMYAYILHAVLIRSLKLKGFFDLSFFDTAAGLLLLTLFLFVLAVLLSSAPVRRATHWVIEPKADWLFRTPSAPARPRTAPAAPPTPPAPRDLDRPTPGDAGGSRRSRISRRAEGTGGNGSTGSSGSSAGGPGSSPTAETIRLPQGHLARVDLRNPTRSGIRW